MIRYGARKIAVLFLKEDIINEDDKEIYEYVLELLISTVINLLLVLMLSSFFRDIGQGILYFLVLATLRPYAGGFHASSYTRCGSLYCIIFIIIACFSRFLNYFEINPALFLLVLLINLCVIRKYAPVLHRNKLTDEEKMHAKKKAVSRCMVWIILAMAICRIGQIWTYTIVLSITAITALMAVGKGMEERRHEKGD